MNRMIIKQQVKAGAAMASVAVCRFISASISVNSHYHWA